MAFTITPPENHPGVFSPGRQFAFEDKSVWTITHNMGYRPLVAVTLDFGEEIEAAPVHISDNVLEIRFNRPRSGKARCV